MEGRDADDVRIGTAAPPDRPAQDGRRGRGRRAAEEELGDRIAEQAFHLDAAMHRLLTDVRAFDEARYWAVQGAVSCAAWLSWRVGWTPGTGREHVRVARALGTLPLIDAALAAGRLSYSKVRAITRVATPATEALLLNDAIHTTAAQLETICRKFATVQRLNARSPEELRAHRTVTRRTRSDGMVVIEAVLPPEEAAIVYAAIEHEAMRSMRAEPPAPETRAAHVPAETRAADVPAETRDANGGAERRAGDVSAGTRPEQRLDRADGLVAMCQAVLRGEAPARAPIDLVLTIRRDALTSAGHDAAAGAGTEAPLAVGTFADGTSVSAETARRLACDCGVVELEEDAAGRPLSVGRRTRTVPSAIARALARRDPTCRFPGCTNRHFLEAHHLVHWIDGGETSCDKLARFCAHHHRFVHEHGHRIEWRDSELAFFDAAGRRVVAEPPRTVRAPLGWASIRAAAAAAQVDIDASTGRSRWDGEPVDVAWVVDGLVRAEYRRAQA